MPFPRQPRKKRRKGKLKKENNVKEERKEGMVVQNKNLVKNLQLLYRLIQK